MCYKRNKIAHHLVPIKASMLQASLCQTLKHFTASIQELRN
jgi:hypothetical protein